MSIENIKMRKVARELQEFIFLGINEGMIRSAQEYKKLLSDGRTIEAEANLKRAVDMPFRALARIEEYEKNYTTEYLDKCLALYGDVTLEELKIEIKKLQPYALNKALDILNPQISNTIIADNIISNIKGNVKDWTFNFPEDYKEICEKNR